MNSELILADYHNTVRTNSRRARELIKKLDYRKDPYLLQCIAQTYLDECLFEIDGTPRIYIEKRKCRMAERYIIKAFKIDPECADVLYTMGSVRRLYSQPDIATYCYKKIIQLGVKRITCGCRKVSAEYARELINDSKFQLYRIYYETNPGLSKRYLAMYKKGLQKGVHTIYKPLNKFLMPKL